MTEPDKDLAGKVIVVTGANTGIGRITARELARRGARVVVTGRTRERAAGVIDEIRALRGEVDFLALELASLASVRRAAEEILDRNHPIHVLINNAGLAGARGATEDGFELTFGVNHLGPFFFTNLLLERLRASAPARVVTVASHAHYQAPGIDFAAFRKKTASLTGFLEYRVSKLANVLFSRELARRTEGSGITSYALHPGVIASDVWRSVPWPVRPVMKRFMLTIEEGARTPVWCATAPELAGESGLYYDEHQQRKEPSPIAKDDALMRELWERSADWCRLQEIARASNA